MGESIDQSCLETYRLFAGRTALSKETHRITDIRTFDQRLTNKHPLLLLLFNLVMARHFPLINPLAKRLELRDPCEMETHVGGKYSRVQHMPKAFRIELSTRGVRFFAGCNRAEQEREAVFAQELEDEHAVHVFEHGFVVVHFG